jgi:prepilin-type N-terminal cleavage/methylation domain-containing protein
MRKLKSGFTLIELVVVMAIIAILAGAGVASYSTLATSKASDQETKRLTDTLELAKKKALANDQSYPCSSVNVSTPNLYGFQVVINSTGYNLVMDCVDVTGKNFNTYTVSSYTFPSIVTVTSATPNTVEFMPLTVRPSMTNTNQIVIHNSASNKNKCISVSITGVIESDVSCSAGS